MSFIDLRAPLPDQPERIWNKGNDVTNRAFFL